jgi:putative nucleotidyltransferase with HDIG domain/excisionase family DNA binding protein
MKKGRLLKVLLVEDEYPGGGLVKRILKKDGYDSTDLIQTISGESDLKILREQPFDLVLLDYPLAGAKAMDVMKRVREMKLDIPVTMITGEESARAALKNIGLGSYDYGVKIDLLSAREAAAILGVTVQTIKNYIYSGRLKTQKTPGGHHRIRWDDLLRLGFLEEGPSKMDLYRAYMETLESVVNALDRRDGNQSGHSRRVASMVVSLMEIMGISGAEQRIIELAALLHDIGKIMISEQVLSKPGKLTDQERYIVRQHPELGEKIVSGVEFLQGAQSIIRHHHERFDGEGYPDGLSGGEIPLGARMISLAGAFDCITSECTYHSKVSNDDAVSEIERCAGAQFDPEIARIFLKNRDEVVRGTSGVT